MAEKAVYGPENCKIQINKWRVKEGYHVNLGQVILSYTECDTNDKEVKKLKANRNGIVKKRLAKEGDTLEGRAALLELSECAHTTVIKDMCADCGADLRQNDNGNQSEASVSMIHSMPDLKVSNKLAQKLGQADTKRLLEDKKLVLLVDLDQTIIHTTNDAVPNNIKGIYHFQLYGPHSPWYHTRLRPGTQSFLTSISAFYELHICTFGARNYAHTIAQFLDPDGKFFSHRILSRDECFNINSKTDNLKSLFPCGDSMVCIIDDREDVWNMAPNLIQVKPYHFFQHTGDINAPPGLEKHELDGKGVDFEDLNKLCENSSDNGSVENVQTKDKNSQSDYSNSTVNNETNLIEGCSSNSDVENKNENSDLENVDTNELNRPNFDCSLKSNSNEQNAEISTENKVIVDKSDFKEIQDPDDYLLYLESILKSIHTRFYEIYDKTKEIPDLKVLIPKIRAEVLKGLNLVFSGLVPTNMKLEQSRSYLIAKSLGANVSQQIVNDTTHLVAVTTGTFKVSAARKRREIKIVNPDWLWCCAERWECVNEKLFPLDTSKQPSKQRQPPAHCHSPEHVVNYSEKSEISSEQLEPEEEAEKFVDTINPLLSFSNDDLADMNKEFDQFFESDSSSDDEPVDIENPPIGKSLRKRKREADNEIRQNEFFNRSDKQEFSINEENMNSSDDDEDPVTKFRRGEDVTEDLDLGSDSNSEGSEQQVDEEDDGEWNMMGAALEREFLGLED
ncbi:RNA polymerase II subunit A C-terminal domain phosphatase [Condylostylus longicornis]|uniref:RNA polymerase II subunit A C-terminal domain phosphatase n=1 Tax=Condylostylus longicornis TaxID=2530218 RepID=UPI00244DA272|nr:RNA polymerase II subunit A C-terminal domain phosphatase [Condylostylus longicornis]